VPHITGDVVLEHLHRYALAVDLATGKDVLDIACGEGYGGNLLASSARSVTGVDVSLEAVRHAQKKYVRSNLAFMHGSCLDIPIPNRSVDVVVSFETLEHFVEHEQFLGEVRRVLRPGGIFIVSTPDKTIYTGKLGNRNPHHFKELEAAEFEQLLRGSFAHTSFLNQRVGLGSFLAPTAKGDLIEVGSQRGDFEAIEFTPGVAEAVYLIGVASDSPLPALKAGIFEFGREESGAFLTPLLVERALADATKREAEKLACLQADMKRSIAERDSQLAGRDTQIATLHQTLASQSQTIDHLNQTLTAQRQNIENLNQAVESAVSWQTRSWFKRAFHRWRPPWDDSEKAGFFRRLERSIRKRRKRLFGQKPEYRPGAGNEKDNDSPSRNEGREERRAQSVLTRAKAVSGLDGERSGRPKVIFISGEPHFVGYFYRVQMHADALASLGCSVGIIRADEIVQNMPIIKAAQVAIIWRAPWSDELAQGIAVLKQNGAKLVFDVDDYMFDPALARTDIVDGIRSQGFTEPMISDYYRRVQKTMLASDFCTCTTEPLAAALRGFHKATFVLPNGFDHEGHIRSRRALAERRAGGSDGLIRIGFAGGTRTHQKDFVCAVPAVARILREHPECRLVLFVAGQKDSGVPLVATEEFPELEELASQIEWRKAVPLRELPQELARFDINLAPLQTGNPFCEAKSELKYFEAALVEVPTVASTTIPFAESIRHEQTGFLVANPEDWFELLKRLVTQPELRMRIGKAAYLDVLWPYGSKRRREMAETILMQVIDVK